jgi:hypothetical protein
MSSSRDGFRFDRFFQLSQFSRFSQFLQFLRTPKKPTHNKLPVGFYYPGTNLRSGEHPYV